MLLVTSGDRSDDNNIKRKKAKYGAGYDDTLSFFGVCDYVFFYPLIG